MNWNSLTIVKKTALVVVIFFALVGFFFTLVFAGMQIGLFNVRGSITERNKFFQTATSSTKTTEIVPAQPCDDPAEKVCDWSSTPEWVAIAGGLQKDTAVIDRVSQETGVPARMIVSVVVPEQMRFFTSEREVFKRVFEPLKILGSMSQFSLGVSGIKQETANNIEGYAGDPTSPYFVGTTTAELIAYPQGVEHDSTLYARLTDEHNHYYSYLYTAIYIREVEEQWKRAGFDISNNAAVIATLFNIGFQKSVPNASPEVGGATITAGGRTYAYGELAQAFYSSNELRDIFTR
jgi:hypothetical protein